MSDVAAFGVGVGKTEEYFFDLASGTKLVYEFHAYENRGRDIDIKFRIVGPSGNLLVNETLVKLGKGEIKPESTEGVGRVSVLKRQEGAPLNLG